MRRPRLDVARVLDPVSWQGSAGVATREHVRAALAPLAAKHDLDVDEVVTLAWRVAFDPKIGFRAALARDPAALFLRTLGLWVSTHRESDLRMVGDETARRTCASPQAQAVKGRLGELAEAITAAGTAGDVARVEALRRQVAQERAQLRSLSRPVRIDTFIEPAQEPASSGTSVGGSDGPLGSALELLVSAGMGRRRAQSVLEAVAASASGCRNSSGSGVGAVRSRARRDRGTAARLGLSASRWQAVVDLVIGSPARPGVPARLVAGEPPEQVRADARFRELAGVVAGKRGGRSATTRVVGSGMACG